MAGQSGDSSYQFEPTGSVQDSARLAQLLESRNQLQPQRDYPVGPGDVLEITATEPEELKKKEVRVGGDGTIDLPLVGVVQAAGLSQAQLSAAIDAKLDKYMYQPHVQVFVREFHSRQVAVVGAVRNPGLITLNGSGDTVLEMLSRAGGTMPDAGDQIVFFPAEETNQGNGTHEGIRPVSASVESGVAGAPAALDRRDTLDGNRDALPTQSLIPTNGHPLVIPLRSTSLMGEDRYLELPVRPGDVIVVPRGGEVMVIGWVQTPGHFKAGSGLTVLAAVGAAGGPMYAADEDRVQLIRTNGSGGKQMKVVDLKAIKSGDAPDPLVEANDVINVPYSPVKIGPYVFYSILTRIGFGFGGALPFL